MKNKNKQTYITYAFLLLFSVVLIRTAWLSDDAAITLRTVLNFINGYGARFNIDERVQAYTHPLWFLTISIFTLIFKNIYFSIFILSIGCSLITFWLLLKKISKTITAQILVGLIILLAKSYLDYSTSGLENPLSHLLILIVVITAVQSLYGINQKLISLFFLICSLIYLNRPDLLILIAPVAIYLIIKNRDKPTIILKGIFVGFVPIALWTIFSIYYYGFPFPNTAYAKLATGISYEDRVIQGLYYIKHSINTDALSICIIVLGALIGMFSKSINACLSVGVVLYLFYIVSIGGDFMEGRFLTSPLLVATIIFAQSNFNKKYYIALIGLILGLGLINIKSTLLSDELYSNTRFSNDGIADERGYYFQHTGLLVAKENTFKMPEWNVTSHSLDVACGGLGFKSIFAGPGAHFIDVCGLADPFLARMPTLSIPMRVGHYERRIPEGYYESVNEDRNIINDEGLKKFYDLIRNVTRNDLNDLSRIRAIKELNFKKYTNEENLKYRYRINKNEELSFKLGSKGSQYLKDNGESLFKTKGWAVSESWGTWSIGNVSTLRLAIPSKEQPAKLEFKAQVILLPDSNAQTIEVFKVNGEDFEQGNHSLIKTINLKGDNSKPIIPITIQIPLNKNDLDDGYINLKFKFPTPVQPRILSKEATSTDDRDLTLGLITAEYK